MGELQLQPVRKRGRLGLDRGAVVAMAILGLIGLALLKPWSNQASSSLEASDAAAQADAASPISTGQPQSDPISLVEVRARATAAGADHASFSAFVATTREAARVPFHDSAPLTGPLSPDCTDGVLLGEGTGSIGFTTDIIPVTGIAVARTFDASQPVPINVSEADSAADGRVVAPAEGGTFALGHYMLTIKAYGAIHYVPFCVGRMVRLTDYSLVRVVPADTYSAAARVAFLADMQSD